MRTRLLALTAFCYGVGFGLMWALLATPSLQLDVYPRVCGAPCTLRVTIRVDPQPDNRHLVVTVVGDRYESGSVIDLEGADAPRTHVLPLYRELPSGQYEVVVVLQTSTRTVARATQTLEVY